MSELHDLHAQLLQMLDELEELTAQPAPDEAALASLRYRLTRTSSARRRLIDSLCIELRPTLLASEVAPLDVLHGSNTAAMTASSEHISIWSLREIVKNWPGYCQASLALRRSMRAQIEAERAVLYPHLQDGS
ncbi:hypothetical protein [Sphingomonas psychrotolerans]|uniref:Uncharacterized protein n=1 Tax=Sphingomonas psychrotolerans TaxID=1327635 RepID=A0A2K8MBI4_9SPHN|nr:hypothetical protein [Sphingomonas psychrotolerans]ATY31252.1 hypothetical protein CVN68_04035 [Sphingomonas psychrotolerans]